MDRLTDREFLILLRDVANSYGPGVVHPNIAKGHTRRVREAVEDLLLRHIYDAERASAQSAKVEKEQFLRDNPEVAVLPPNTELLGEAPASWMVLNSKPAGWYVRKDGSEQYWNGTFWEQAGAHWTEQDFGPKDSDRKEQGEASSPLKNWQDSNKSEDENNPHAPIGKGEFTDQWGGKWDDRGAPTQVFPKVPQDEEDTGHPSRPF